MDFKYLVTATRPRIYLLWAVLVPVGFVATNFYQRHAINALWTVIAIIGLGYMLRVMPLRQVSQMRRIFGAWLMPIVLGLVVSGVVFYVHTAAAGNLIGHLGAFWLGVMAVGYLLNGLADSPGHWYFYNVAINAVFCVLCFTVTAFVPVQYLVAAIVSGWSMLNLWLLRADS